MYIVSYIESIVDDPLKYSSSFHINNCDKDSNTTYYNEPSLFSEKCVSVNNERIIPKQNMLPYFIISDYLIYRYDSFQLEYDHSLYGNHFDYLLYPSVDYSPSVLSSNQHHLYDRQSRSYQSPIMSQQSKNLFSFESDQNQNLHVHFRNNPHSSKIKNPSLFQSFQNSQQEYFLEKQNQLKTLRCIYFSRHFHFLACSWTGIDNQIKQDSESFIQRLDLHSPVIPPGEHNPNAIPGGKLCFEFMNKGK